MKKTFLIFVSLVLWFGQSMAQSEVLKPILLDKEVLSGIGLDKMDIKDEPKKDFYQKKLYYGNDLSVYVVSTNTWNNRMDDFPFDEFIYMFHGEAKVTPDQGKEQLFHTGDYFFAPKGYTGAWEILAGYNLHYELSVIATKRSDSSTIKKEQSHLLFDKSTLSGVDIDLRAENPFTEVMVKGAELTVTLCAEKPGSKMMDAPSEEMMIHVLSGLISITDKEGIESTFYTGDFFIVPKGFTGKWSSDGHGLIKFLAVTRS